MMQVLLKTMITMGLKDFGGFLLSWQLIHEVVLLWIYLDMHQHSGCHQQDVLTILVIQHINQDSSLLILRI
jgi:hypothetical protein